MTRSKRVDGIPYFNLGGSIRIDKKFMVFVRRRIGGLANFDQSHRPFISLLANAYVLGMKDAVDAIESEKQ